MAVAEACIIKSFKRDYISCNLYYSKCIHSVLVRNQSYKKDFIYSYFVFFALSPIFYSVIILPCANLHRNHAPSFASCHDKKHMPPSWQRTIHNSCFTLFGHATSMKPARHEGTKNHPIPCPAAENGVLVLFTLYFLRSPISFFSSLKKLSTSANC